MTRPITTVPADTARAMHAAYFGEDTTMDDAELVKRLREVAAATGPNDAAKIAWDAADRIEALAAERDEAERREKTASDVAVGYLQRAEAAESALKEAVDVLMPFAEASETWMPEEPSDATAGARLEHPKYGMEQHAAFTFGDLFKAHAFLAKHGATK